MPLLRRDIDEDGRAAPGFRHQPAIAELLLHAIRLRLRLVDLVDRHNDRHVGRLGVVDCFERLRHHAVVRRDHDDDDIRDLRAACTHAGEGLVTRGIEEDDLAAECRRVLLGDADLVGTDVLRDATGLAGGDVGFADRIQQRGLAVIDVTHDSDDRWTHDFDLADVLLSEQRFERFVRHLVFEADDAGVGAELTRHILHQLSIERLVHGDEDTAHQERRDEILAADSELFRQVLDADALGHRDGAGDGQRLLRNLRSAETRWRRKALHRAFLGLRVLLASTAAWRTARTLRARRLARRRHQATGTGTHAGTLAEARTTTWATRTRAKARTATRCAAWRRARGMHRPATRRKTWSAGRSAGTLRIAARATRTLEDRTSTLNDTTGAGRRSGPLGRSGARRRRTVDGPWTGLRHDHTLDRCSGCCWGFRSLRRGRDRWCCRLGRRRRGDSRRRRRSGRWCSHRCRRWRRRWRSRDRARHHWTRRRSRGNGRALCYRRGRSSADRRTRDDWAGRRLRGDRGSLRWRRGHNRRRLTRLRHHDTARSRSFDLRRDRRARRCGWRRCRAGRDWSRRCGRFGRCRRRSLRTRRGALCLFLALLNRLKNITGLGHPRPVDLLRCSVALRRGRAAIAAASALEVRADALRLIGFERARMRLGVRHSNFAQYVQNRLALDLELSC